MNLIRYSDFEPKKGLRLSREHIRRMRKAGTFPEPLVIGENLIAWREDEIDEWIETRPRAAAAARTTLPDPRQIPLELGGGSS